MKKLKNYDIENIVRNTLIVLMLINAIVIKIGRASCMERV